jgi:uncharacterized protein (DUF983 family)
MDPMAPPDPGREGPAVRIAPATMIGRALRKRCPVCGSGHLFDRWFTMKPRCPRCGLVFARTEGSMSGDIGINSVVTVALLFVVLLGGTLLMWNDLNVALLAVLATFAALVFPLLFFPFSKTIWLTIDLLSRPLEPGEADEAAL